MEWPVTVTYAICMDTKLTYANRDIIDTGIVTIEHALKNKILKFN